VILGKYLTPSVVSFSKESSQVCVGAEAISVRSNNLENTVFGKFFRTFWRIWSFCLDVKRLFGGAFLDQNCREFDRYVPFQLVKLVDVGNRPIIKVEHDGKVIIYFHKIFAHYPCRKYTKNKAKKLIINL
jgi:molecular chaperone DnaK (HSP70)